MTERAHCRIYIVGIRSERKFKSTHCSEHERLESYEVLAFYFRKFRNGEGEFGILPDILSEAYFKAAAGPCSDNTGFIDTCNSDGTGDPGLVFLSQLSARSDCKARSAAIERVLCIEHVVGIRTQGYVEIACGPEDKRLEGLDRESFQTVEFAHGNGIFTVCSDISAETEYKRTVAECFCYNTLFCSDNGHSAGYHRLFFIVRIKAEVDGKLRPAVIEIVVNIYHIGAVCGYCRFNRAGGSEGERAERGQFNPAGCSQVVH